MPAHPQVRPCLLPLHAFNSNRGVSTCCSPAQSSCSAGASHACVVCAGGPALGGEAAASVSNSLITVRENAQEYDPARPNDYEEVRRSREAARKAAEAEAERQARIKADALRQEARRALSTGLSALRSCPALLCLRIETEAGRAHAPFNLLFISAGLHCVLPALWKESGAYGALARAEQEVCRALQCSWSLQQFNAYTACAKRQRQDRCTVALSTGSSSLRSCPVLSCLLQRADENDAWLVRSRRRGRMRRMAQRRRSGVPRRAGQGRRWT